MNIILYMINLNWTYIYTYTYFIERIERVESNLHRNKCLQ